MAKYLVSNPDGAEQPINPSEFASRIKSTWLLEDLSVLLNTGEENTRAVSWFMDAQGRGLDGCLFKNGHLALDGDIRDCSNFAIWYRQQVPQQLKLVFYDDSYNADIALTNETTEQDIIATFCE